jgi:hypothetical protein
MSGQSAGRLAWVVLLVLVLNTLSVVAMTLRLGVLANEVKALRQEAEALRRIAGP